LQFFVFMSDLDGCVFDSSKRFPLTLLKADDGKMAVTREVWKFPCVLMTGEMSFVAILWLGGCLPPLSAVERQFRSVLGYVNFPYQTSCFPAGVESYERRVGCFWGSDRCLSS
jgi:hypothetical protein